MLARVIAVVLLGVGLWIGVEHSRTVGRNAGKEAFLARQSARFDEWFAKKHSAGAGCLTGVLMAGAAFGGYELLSLGIFALIKPKRSAGAA